MTTTTTPVEQVGKRLVFEDTIGVEAPVEEVYRRWSDFPRFPEFMKNVEEVRPQGGNRYHWVARIFGIRQEWDAEVTDREDNRRISWRSLNGSESAGTVYFTSAPAGTTQIRLRMEYTPPAGTVGAALDKLTKTTQREVHEDLKNFRRALAPQGLRGGDEAPDMDGIPMVAQVAGSLANVAVWGALGGTVAHRLIERVQRQSSTRSRLMARPMEYLTDKAFGTRGMPLLMQPKPSPALSYATGALAGGSILAAAAMRLMNRKHDSLFIGQWAPTFLSLGALTWLVGETNVRTPALGRKISWGLTSAALGSILTSLFWHARGYRKHGLFVGQWAPTLLLGAVFARILRPR